MKNFLPVVRRIPSDALAVFIFIGGAIAVATVLAQSLARKKISVAFYRNNPLWRAAMLADSRGFPCVLFFNRAVAVECRGDLIALAALLATRPAAGR